MGIGIQGISLGLPLGHVGQQHVTHGLRVGPRLGGQHFNTLRHHHGGFSLHLGAVLQVFYEFDAFVQLHFNAGQGLFGQRRTRFGCIALPSQGVSNIQLGLRQQGVGFFSPFLANMFLHTGALDVVELFAQGLGCAFVFAAELFKDFLHFLRARVGGQPFAHFGGAVARGGGRKSAARQTV